ncbi:MAG: SDR family oxidoreductase [Raineya sp.]|jgi:NAD(P)-dependent dehydrogenase (short-subunit alcohol dehydrogenase family)|nr:SDR family oxidoreductase [Raineya sp.]
MAKVALITGSTAGIGKETALGLAKMGMELILPVRNAQKGEAIKQEILKQSPQAQVRLYDCNLASLKSIQTFTEQVKKDYPQIHVLINNAGVWQQNQALSDDGIEMTFAVNHLAPFLLTNLLLDTLKNSAPARIVNVASDLHQGDINFSDIEFKKSFSGIGAYKQSKLANILFTRLLAKKIEGTNITTNALMPGFIATELFRNIPAFLRWIIPIFAKTPKQGAETSIYLATSEEVKFVSGEYFKNKKRGSSSYNSKNIQTAQRLWEISEQYIQKVLS